MDVMCGQVCANPLAGEICDHRKVKLAEQQRLFQVCLCVCETNWLRGFGPI